MLTGGPYPFDLTFSHWLQAFQTDGLTSFMGVVSVLGQPLLSVPLTLLLAAWWAQQGKQSLAILIVVIIAGNLLPIGLKEVFDRPRPSSDDVILLEYATGKSFPSAHAVGAMLFSGLVMYIAHIGRRAKAFWIFLSLVFVLAVGLSRVYLGAHWLSDVLGGYAIGMFWLLLVFWLAWPKIRLRLVQAEQAEIEAISGNIGGAPGRI